MQVLALAGRGWPVEAQGQGQEGHRQGLAADGQCQEVGAHGAVIIDEAGSLLSTHLLPQQTGLVYEGAKHDGCRDGTCHQTPPHSYTLSSLKLSYT